MKGEMPVPYVVAIIIAAIVIGLLIFWLLKVLGVFGSQSSVQMCLTRLNAACALKSDDTTINPISYDECKGTAVVNKVRNCGELRGYS